MLFSRDCVRFFPALVAVLVISSTSVFAQGILLRGSGAVNESMAGASIAAPIDAAGAIYTNPAGIAGLEQCEIGFDLGIIVPKSTVSSEITGMTSTRYTTRGDAGQIPCPVMSMVYRECPHARITYGISIAGVGGAVSLYPATGSPLVNPILLGEARAANVQIFEIMPTVAYKMTDRLALGFSPVVGLASLSINPMSLGLDPTQPMQNYGTRYTWGGGFNLGAYYDFQNNWKAGFTFKSPLWTDSLRFTGTEHASFVPQEVVFDINLPLILGWGVSYSGFKKTLIALDIKYFDYGNTAGFRGIMENGRVTGLGWDSIMSVAVGMQYELTQRLKLRMGYCFNENPIPPESQYANVSSPLFMQHTLCLGGTIGLPKSIDAHLTWVHAFQNEVTGSFQTTQASGSVTNTVYADTFVFGVTKRF